MAVSSGGSASAGDPVAALVGVLQGAADGRQEFDLRTGSGRRVTRDATGKVTQVLESGVVTTWTFAAGVPTSVTQAYGGQSKTFQCDSSGTITGV